MKGITLEQAESARADRTLARIPVIHDPAISQAMADLHGQSCHRCGGTGERLLVDEWIRVEDGGEARHRVWAACECRGRSQRT